MAKLFNKVKVKVLIYHIYNISGSQDDENRWIATVSITQLQQSKQACMQLQQCVVFAVFNFESKRKKRSSKRFTLNGDLLRQSLFLNFCLMYFGYNMRTFQTQKFERFERFSAHGRKQIFSVQVALFRPGTVECHGKAS